MVVRGLLIFKSIKKRVLAIYILLYMYLVISMRDDHYQLRRPLPIHCRYCRSPPRETQQSPPAVPKPAALDLDYEVCICMYC